MKTSEQIIKDASSEKDIKDYSLLELHLYLVIKQILKMYFNNQINKEQANIYKQQAVSKYEKDIKNYEFQQSMFKEHIKNIRDTEDLRRKLRKKLNNNEEITEASLSDIINICLEIIEITYERK